MYESPFLVLWSLYFDLVRIKSVFCIKLISLLNVSEIRL